MKKERREQKDKENELLLKFHPRFTTACEFKYYNIMIIGGSQIDVCKKKMLII